MLGHSAATYAQTTAAFDAGAAGLVHCYNGMTGLHHREPGMVGAGLTDPRAWLELIADGHHVHPGAMRLCCCCAKDRTVLITDAMQAAGMPDGAIRCVVKVSRCRAALSARPQAGLRAARSRWMPPCEIWWSIRGRPRASYPYGFTASRPSAWYGSPAGIVSAGQTRQYYCAGCGFTPPADLDRGSGSFPVALSQCALLALRKTIVRPFFSFP